MSNLSCPYNVHRNTVIAWYSLFWGIEVCLRGDSVHCCWKGDTSDILVGVLCRLFMAVNIFVLAEVLWLKVGGWVSWLRGGWEASSERTEKTLQS